MGGTAPMIVSATPDHTTAELACNTLKFCCCAETAKNIDTEVGGAMINGVSVKKLEIIDPTQQVTAVAMMEAVSS